MEKKQRYSLVLVLISLVWGTSAFNSYAEEKDKEAVKVKEEKELSLAPTRTLKKAKSEESKVTGGVTWKSAYNIGETYPMGTSLNPSKIITKKAAYEKVNFFAQTLDVELNANKKWIFENDEVFDTTLEVGVSEKGAQLQKMFLVWKKWTIGIAGSNFAAHSSNVAQVSWKKSIDKLFTVAIGIERSEEFRFPEGPAFKPLKTIKHLPAASAMVKYYLSDALGSIELNGLITPVGWYNETKKSTEMLLGYGVNIGSTINIRPETNILTTSLIAGQSIGEYIGDLSALASVNKEPVNMYFNGNKETGMLVGAASVKYEHHWTPYLRSTFRVAATNIFNDDKQRDADQYKWGGCTSGNLAYWFTEHTAVGLGYTAGLRKNVDDKKQDAEIANQLQATFEFKI